MREMERKKQRALLDREMWHYRCAAKEMRPTSDLLRAVRRAVRIPMGEIARKMGVTRSTVFELEVREQQGMITLRSLARIAEAMGCKVVYGVVPQDGKTLEMLAEERLWRSVIGGKKDRGQGDEVTR
jgi:hypothetical protein